MNNRRYRKLFLSLIFALVLTSVPLLITIPSFASLQIEPTSEPMTTSTKPPFDWLFKNIRDLFATNLGCPLPCFAGLEVGESTLEDIDDAINAIDYNRVIARQLNDGENNHFSLFFRQRGMLSVDISTENEVLQRIRIGLTEPNIWLSKNIFDVPNVINDLGVPDNVFILFHGPPLRFTTALLYNRKGALLIYRSEFYQKDIDPDQPLSLCYSREEVDLYQIDVWLQNPEGNDLVEDNQPDLRDAERENRPFWPLEKVAGIDEAAFAQLFIDDPDSCIEALSGNELSEQGYVF